MINLTLFKIEITKSSDFSSYRIGLLLVFLLIGCAPPIGISEVTPVESYQIATTTPLSKWGR